LINTLIENENFLPANSFNRYQILEQIYLSKVVGIFLAKDLLKHEIVVMKRIDCQIKSKYKKFNYLIFTLLDNDQVIHSEDKHLCKIKHPNINQFKAIFMYEKQLYIVMNYINGETLENYLAFHKDISEKDIKNIISQIRHGLLACQGTWNKYHLKINPSNISINKDLHIIVIIIINVV